MYVGAALSVLGILFGLAQGDEIREQVLEDDPGLTADEVDTAVAVGQGAVVFIGLITVGLWIWMAVMNGKGKNWARITGTVLGGINVLLVLLGLVGAALQPTPPLATVMNVVGLVLAVVIIILMYQRDSSAYYEAMSQQASPYQYGSGF